MASAVDPGIGDSGRLDVVVNSAGIDSGDQMYPADGWRTIAHILWTPEHSSFRLWRLFLSERTQSPLQFSKGNPS
jgi:hypothetical protein